MISHKSLTASFLSHSFSQAKEHLILPWLRELSFSPLPSAVLSPNASTNAAIKELAVRNNIPLINLHFFTPGSLRSFLSQKVLNSPLPPLREDLHLIMRLCALEFLKKNHSSPISRATLKNPERIVQIYDTFSAANQPFSALPDPDLVDLLSLFSSKLKENNLLTVQNIDNSLRLHTFSSPLFQSTLSYGFSHAQPSANSLIHTLLNASINPTICLHTSLSASTSEQAWLGTWESFFDNLIPLPENDPHPYASYAQAFEFPQLASIPSDASFQTLIFKNIWQEADAIVSLAKAYLTEDSPRIAIVVPSTTSPLAREVSKRLQLLKIPHFDHLGHTPAPSASARLLLSFLAWQESPRLSLFTKFLDCLLEQDFIDYLDYNLLKKSLRNAFPHLMTEDTTTLFNYLKLTDPTAYSALSSLLSAWPAFPDSAHFSDFLNLAVTITQKIQYPKDPDLLRSRAKILLQTLSAPISKELFLLWLKSICHTLGRIRSSSASHPFAPVQLVTQDQALLQPWTHLILSSLNQSSWPRPHPPNPLLPDAAIQSINQASISQGPQGEGHLIVANDKSLLHSTSDRLTQDESLFSQLIESPSTTLTLTAHLNDPLSPGREIPPSEFLERLYLIAHNQLLSPELLNSIQEQSLAWLNSTLIHAPVPPSPETLQTLQAYNHRRNPESPYSEYSYSFKTPQPFTLSAKAWENTLQNPEDAWFKNILKVQKPPHFQTQEAKSLAIGTWVHDWLTIYSEDLTVPQPVPSIESWVQSITKISNASKSRVAQAFSAAQKSLPSWWKAHFHEAQKAAFDFAKDIASHLQGQFLLSEFSLPKSCSIQTSENYSIPITGRIDLIVTPAQLPPEHPDSHLHILDYKTAKRSPLTLHQLSKGSGLQLALYALAFNNLGPSDISISILNPNSTPKPQLHLDKILQAQNLLLTIEHIHKSGTFGQLHTSSNKFAFVPDLPLATLSIPKETLEKKWNLSHPTFPI